jgi:hypothetical protein
MHNIKLKIKNVSFTVANITDPKLIQLQQLKQSRNDFDPKLASLEPVFEGGAKSQYDKIHILFYIALLNTKMSCLICAGLST